ncbi:hypothetical protein Tco_0712000 [Tanacetum coccineum]
MPIFKRTFSQDLDLLEQHLTKDILSRTDCTTTLTNLITKFENAFNSEFEEQKEDSNSETASSKSAKECSLNSETQDVHAIKYKMSKAKKRCMAYFLSLHSHLQVLSKEDLKGTRVEHGFKWAFMSLFGQDVDTFTKRTCQQRQYDKRVNKRQTQTQESKIDTGKATYADLVDKESIRTNSIVKDESSRSGNDIDADANIRPIYDKEPMAEYPEQCQVKSPMLDSSPDNQTTEYSKQSLDNKVKIKKEIDAYETINIELEHSVAKLLTENEHLNKENETFKKHYKDLYDSIKITRSKTIEQTTSLLANNADLKAQIQEKVFAIAALKNDLRKLKGNSVDTKCAKTSVLGKPVLQSPRNQSVVRQPNVFKFERPQMSKQRFASQVNVNNNLSRPVTQHYLPKRRESVFTKPDHMIASSKSMNISKNMPRFSSNDMVHNHYLYEVRKRHKKDIGTQKLA